MPLPSTDTVVLYPTTGAESLRADGVVLHVQPYGDGRELVLLDRTPAHPVDLAWPDQGSDAGSILVDGREASLLDVVVGATDGTNLFVGDDVPVRRGTEGWAFVVVHVLAEPSRIAVGDEVVVSVDAAHRRALSAGHTLCHVASLALNAAFADRWSKPVREDALGRPDFDHEAIQSSTIVPDGSVDVFRLNKSLRRKGFATEGLDDALDAVASAATATLLEWIATDAPVHIEREGDGLSDPRYWVCELPGGIARIACGGTHLSSLGELGGASVALELGDDAGTTTLTMRCSAATR
ncbi:metal-dependent hydrolase [Humibacter ginsenosidimutans]|uniref:Metal-dependent hydrolase n=1 Tax=Humibacter ginsenosidimutans TaxID=2599293 RepID=A0A5B8M6R0_9MICO|nr:metal-dependent hydrolase [Humibacter ginsenosidimutans]QDZ16083.1 metal-dependent hydrolase [Humibacter ginsenosidimutans]